MATQIKSKKGLKKAFSSSPREVCDYFGHLPKLLDDFPMDVCLAYAFSRLELGQNMALYCGVVRIHKVNADLARSAVGMHHMTRESFVTLYSTVFGLNLPKEAHADLKNAEGVRDLIMHGKQASDDMIRNAIARVLEYATAVNAQLDTKHGLRPYGNLKGFSGRAKKLDNRTSRFVLKGIGFAIA